MKATVMYAPYLRVGQTVSVTDTYNNKSDVKYFIESIKSGNGNTSSLTLARYPA